MLRFKDFILNEVVSIRELYHGSNTGINGANIRSFRTGIDPKRATGYGQGHGFYVFADRNSARHHALRLMDADVANFATGAETSGEPMVVSVLGFLHPEDWDIDYEMNRNAVIQFIRDHIDKFEGMTVPANGDTFSVTGLSQRVSGIMFQRGSGGRTGRAISPDGGSAADGELFSQLMQGLAKRNPQVVHDFKVIFFDNLRPGIAIKYVGEKSLQIRDIEVFDHNRWIKQ